MNTLLITAGTLGLGAVWLFLWHTWRAVRPTTLWTAWGWAAGALAFWSVTWTVTTLFGRLEAGAADRLWYLAAVVLLCPFVAVLGARKPGYNTWNWFVLVPLVLVLGLPAGSVRSVSALSVPLEIPVPAAVGFALVALMGAGNYFGTRYTLPAFLLATAALLSVGSLTLALSRFFPSTDHSRIWATLLLACSALLAAWKGTRASADRTRFDRLWMDFCDLYGIVWAKRVMDRVNRDAEEQKWPVRLELHGFVRSQTQDDSGDPAEFDERVEATLRWVLRRYVEPEWINQRLETPPAAPDVRAETP